MIYMGSKNKLSKEIAPIIQSYIDNNNITHYLEPFVGGANMIDKIDCQHKYGCDKHKYLIAALNALQSGWIPPYEISTEQYINIKNNQSEYEDALVGYVGFELSFGAKWFGGYAKRDDKKKRGDIYSYKSCMKQSPNLKNIVFKNCDFREIKSSISNYVIYCDPPYRDTTKYSTFEFPYEEFYDWCRMMSKNNIVLISEYTMPEDFECIWQKQVKCTLDKNTVSNKIEKLWRYSNE